MEKTLVLNNKEYRLQSSVYTLIDYKLVFGVDIFDDTDKMAKFDVKTPKNVSKVIEVIFKVFYIMTRPKNRQSYDEFLMSLDF